MKTLCMRLIKILRSFVGENLQYIICIAFVVFTLRCHSSYHFVFCSVIIVCTLHIFHICIVLHTLVPLSAMGVTFSYYFLNYFIYILVELTTFWIFLHVNFFLSRLS